MLILSIWYVLFMRIDRGLQQTIYGSGRGRSILTGEEREVKSGQLADRM